jgi:radical SAM family uncharacterized protein
LTGLAGITMTLKQIISEELLPYVQQPGQYIGQEFNQLVSAGDWEAADVRVAIAFPDAYNIGMSHLGCQILYWLCNHTPGVCAERVYCPWLDAEQRMKDKRIPLFTWDSRQPVASADILGISLQYEMCFTNVLSLLDLAGIPLRSSQRDDRHPLIIAGGPQADNPEPMADFLDLVVLGDGEESMAAILSAVSEMKANGVRRRDMIYEIARRHDWAYAPAYYEVKYTPEGTVASVCPTHDDLPTTLVRCQTPDLSAAPFPTRPLVPHTEVVHDRISIEIMRGCPQRCRFCHAGYTKRPLGFRTVDDILEIAEHAWRTTGMSELGLLSLSTADYPELPELARRTNERFAPRMVNISVPSLRVDRMLQSIPWMVNSVRKSGLTIAVEAAKDDMRAAIRKKVTDGRLLDGVREAYKAGWKSVKCYYMSGFPGERPEDITGIWELSEQISRVRCEFNKPPARVNASVGWLVPKPFTPFQWAAQPRVGYFREVRARLNELAPRRSAVRIKTHDPDRSILEGVFSRGDRRLGASVEWAWRHGARFDGWDECFDATVWRRAFQATSTDPDFYAHRERGYEEVLPWAHINGGPAVPYLEGQYDDVFTQIGADKPLPVLAQ